MEAPQTVLETTIYITTGAGRGFAGPVRQLPGSWNGFAKQLPGSCLAAPTEVIKKACEYVENIRTIGFPSRTLKAQQTALKTTIKITTSAGQKTAGLVRQLPGEVATELPSSCPTKRHGEYDKSIRVIDSIPV